MTKLGANAAVARKHGIDEILDTIAKVFEDENAEGFVKTANKMGYMTTHIDPYSREFIEEFGQEGKKVVDVGASYGIMTIPLLLGGAEVTALEIDESQKDGLYATLEAVCGELGYDFEGAKDRLQYIIGDIRKPDLAVKDYDGILACRVMHFFSPGEFEMAIGEYHGHLKDGGQLTLVVETPWLGNFYKDVFPIYEKNKTDGKRFPGYIEDIGGMSTSRKKDAPKKFHLFDKETLDTEVSALDFELVTSRYIDRRGVYPKDVQNNGQESLGAHFRKRNAT